MARRSLILVAAAALLGTAAGAPSPAVAAATAATASTSSAAAVAQARPVASAARRSQLAAARRSRLSTRAPLEFGIYPGGGAGAVFGRGEPRPEDPARRAAAVERLRGDGPFVVHLYDAYTGTADVPATPGWLRSQIDDYAARGLRVELVLRYRPQAARGDVAGFVRFVESRVAELGPIANVTSLQIANEVNVTVAPDAADGAYPGAASALAGGVIAAKRAVRRLGHEQLAIGFNWANEHGPQQRAFFASLRRLGGAAFARSVDWVGLDAYPGTWGAPLPRGRLPRAVASATEATLRTLRRDLLPRAGLARTPIVFAESGYPTGGGGRTVARQREVMTAAVRAVARLRSRHGVVGYRWFNLRDADSSAPSFEAQYGLMRDDYTPKPAFETYGSLVARHG